MTLYIVRHGQTEENLERILQGHLPGKLTQEGRQQVKRTAERLAQEGTNFKCILTSDLKRAMDSADILAERLHLPVIPMEILRERDWGNYTGLSLAEAKDKYKVDGKWVFPDGSAESEQKSKRLGITVFQPRLKVCTFARTNYYEYGKQRQVQESP